MKHCVLPDSRPSSDRVTNVPHFLAPVTPATASTARSLRSINRAGYVVMSPVQPCARLCCRVLPDVVIEGQPPLVDVPAGHRMGQMSPGCYTPRWSDPAYPAGV